MSSEPFFCLHIFCLCYKFCVCDDIVTRYGIKLYSRSSIGKLANTSTVGCFGQMLCSKIEIMNTILALREGGEKVGERFGPLGHRETSMYWTGKERKIGRE